MKKITVGYDMTFQQHVVGVGLGESFLDYESRQKVVAAINKLCESGDKTPFGNLKCDPTADNLQHLIDILEVLKSKAAK